ncbi:DegT/DnrJ/EryC1/StrS family aminotransferase [Legionella fairfieldensis]|uniref:DegT/DnrJ/EryC1/StrS family aminotransferase n=1 Tax=Legionella fairfieldensis TaxID=45064 RepID=UPI000686D2CE|nr:DegT/DnrJ/EryC1/StrS family aminotransferase [Legionella fairfieldensis]
MKNIPLFKVFMSPDVSATLNEVLLSGYVGEGDTVVDFESQLSRYIGNNHLVTVNSGTSALHLAYHMALDGQTPKNNTQFEIISTPMTCTATNTPIIANGAKIVWADVDPLTGNIDPQSIKEKITEFTKAIVIVHWGGNPCKIDEIKQIANTHNIKVVEDAAHAMGAIYKEKLIGNHSDYTAFSFQAIKHLTTVDGGLLAVKNEEDTKRAKLLRWYGIDRTVREGIDLRCELDVKEAGYKFHMNNVSAAIGLENLKFLDQIVAKHRSNAEFYNQAFNNIANIRIAKTEKEAVSAYWLYTMHVNNRDEFMKKMALDGITVSKVHARNDTHTMFRAFSASLPQVDEFNRTHVCIPVGWWVTQEEREYIAEKAIQHASSHSSKKVDSCIA